MLSELSYFTARSLAPVEFKLSLESFIEVLVGICFRLAILEKSFSIVRLMTQTVCTK